MGKRLEEREKKERKRERKRKKEKERINNEFFFINHYFPLFQFL